MSESETSSVSSQKSSDYRHHRHHHHHHHHHSIDKHEFELTGPPMEGREEELDERDYIAMKYEAERKAQLAIVEIINESEERKTNAKQEIFRRKIIEVNEKYDKLEQPYIDELRKRGLL